MSDHDFAQEAADLRRRLDEAQKALAEEQSSHLHTLAMADAARKGHQERESALRERIERLEGKETPESAPPREPGASEGEPGTSPYSPQAVCGTCGKPVNGVRFTTRDGRVWHPGHAPRAPAPPDDIEPPHGVPEV